MGTSARERVSGWVLDFRGVPKTLPPTGRQAKGKRDKTSWFLSLEAAQLTDSKNPKQFLKEAYPL